MRISDWSSDVCSSDLQAFAPPRASARAPGGVMGFVSLADAVDQADPPQGADVPRTAGLPSPDAVAAARARKRSEEHTSELQSLMRISYAVFCLKKKNKQTKFGDHHQNTQPTNNKIG